MSESMDFFYDINARQEIEIERYTGYDEKVVIPERIEGLPVAAILEHAFAGVSEVVEVIVPEGVRSIGEEAFADCEDLECVALPASLEQLGRCAFASSQKLRRISFPNGSAAFSVEDGVLYKPSERALICCPPGLELETFTVPTGIETIAAGAFYQNRHLKYVRLPSTLKRIEEGAFLFTPALLMIELPPSLEVIEPGCFLMGPGRFAEKAFSIYAFQNTAGYRYAVENGIPVHRLYATIID